MGDADNDVLDGGAGYDVIKDNASDNQLFVGSDNDFLSAGDCSAAPAMTASVELQVTTPSTPRWRSRLYQALPNGEPCQVDAVVDVEAFHDVILVGFDGFW